MIAIPKHRLAELAGCLSARGVEVRGQFERGRRSMSCEAAGGRVSLTLLAPPEHSLDPIHTEWVVVAVSRDPFRPCSLRGADEQLLAVVLEHLRAFQAPARWAPVHIAVILRSPASDVLSSSFTWVGTCSLGTVPVGARGTESPSL
jgi:hypothetical protein